MAVEIESVHSEVGAPADRGHGIADSLTSREWDQLVDIVVRRLESRITSDLERRGRRFSPRVM